VGPGQNGPTG